MKHSATAAILAMAALPAPLFAHGDLDRGFVLMVFLHSAAHFINDHPVLMAVLGAAMIVGIGIHQRRRGTGVRHDSGANAIPLPGSHLQEPQP